MGKVIRALLIILGLVGAAAGAGIAILVIPSWLVDSSGVVGVSPGDRLQAIAGQRQIVLWVLGGLIAIVGLSYTHLRHSLDRDANRTDRFTTAITQLADKKLEIRVGGIFALERIALDSKRDRGPIMNVLCTFVKARRPRIVDDPNHFPPPLTADISAALSVIGRLPRRPGESVPQLALADLAGADLRKANLRNGDLASADLMATNLAGADLRGADLGPADSMLVGASLYGAYLSSADLRKANLEAADLTDASVAGADFRGAQLRQANFANLNRRLGEPRGLLGLPPLPPIRSTVSDDERGESTPTE